MVIEYKMNCKSVITAVVLIISYCANGQSIKFKYNALGPFTTPLPDADSGNLTPTGMGWIEAIAVAKNSIWASSNSGGLFQSKDNGKHWEPVAFDKNIYGVLDININTEDENDIIISTGTTVNTDPFGIGVLQTMDGGETWKTTALKFEPYQKNVVWQCQRLDKTGENMAAITQNKIYVFNQLKNTNTIVWSGDAQLRQLLKHPSDNATLYASGNKLLISHDTGANWADYTKLLIVNHSSLTKEPIVSRIAIAVFPNSPDYLYAAYNYENVNYIQCSRDKGRTWQVLGTNRAFNRLDIHHAEIAIDEKDSNTIYVGAVRMYKSTDYGKTFELISNPTYGDIQFMHDDIRGIAQDANGNLYTCNDGGVSLSYNKGKTWESINGKGLTVTQVYSMALNPLNNKEMMIGCQDMSTMRLQKGKWSNTSRLYGDGGPCLYWQTNPFRAIVSQNAQLLMSDNNGMSWVSLGNPEITNKLYFPLMNDPEYKEKIYAGFYHLWLRNGDKWWQNLSQEVDGKGFAINSISVVSSEKFKGYLAFDQPVWKTGEALKGKFFKGTQIGENYSWEDLTHKLPIVAWRGITAISTIPNDTLQVWVAIEGLTDEMDKNRVFYSNDGGATFLDISKGLPQCNINKLQAISNRRQHVWAATDYGMYYFDGTQWLKVGKLSPNCIVRDFSFSNNGKELFFATYGRGCFEGKVKRKYRK